MRNCFVGIALLSTICCGQAAQIDSAQWNSPDARVFFTAALTPPPLIVVVTKNGVSIPTSTPLRFNGSRKILDYPVAVTLPVNDPPVKVCMVAAGVTGECVNFFTSDDDVIARIKMVPRPQSGQNIFASGMVTTA